MLNYNAPETGLLLGYTQFDLIGAVVTDFIIYKLGRGAGLQLLLSRGSSRAPRKRWTDSNVLTPKLNSSYMPGLVLTSVVWFALVCHNVTTNSPTIRMSNALFLYHTKKVNKRLTTYYTLGTARYSSNVLSKLHTIYYYIT